MIKNVNNLGPAEPKIQLAGRYLNTSGSATYNSEDKNYYLFSSGVTLLKLDITKFDANMLVSNAKLKLKIKNIQEGGAVFKLYEADSTDYKKAKSGDVTLGTLLDVINYDGKASKYQSKVEDIIEFDLSKYLYNKVKSSSITLW